MTLDHLGARISNLHKQQSFNILIVNQSVELNVFNLNVLLYHSVCLGSMRLDKTNTFPSVIFKIDKQETDKQECYRRRNRMLLSKQLILLNETNVTDFPFGHVHFSKQLNNIFLSCAQIVFQSTSPIVWY